MRVEYVCKHCRHSVGSLSHDNWTEADAVRHTGLITLSPVEQNEAVAYNKDHGVMYVQTVCEHCQQALESHPEVLLEGKLLQ